MSSPEDLNENYLVMEVQNKENIHQEVEKLEKICINNNVTYEGRIKI
jgi:hypothetical protein